uniref:MFS transporter n=1 Tax=Rubrobacter aplysinae TaxID=909625 RepID=UPI00064C3213|nr:MFS transporter [Rubrobacter aplysinae]
MSYSIPENPAPVAARLSVATIFFVNGAVFGSWVSRIPEVQDRLGIGEGVLGLALLAMAIGALVAMPATGWAVSRYGSRTPTLLSALVFCLILPLMAIAPGAVMLGLSLFLFGVFNGSTDVSMNSQAAAIEMRYGRSIMASFHALFSFGGLAGAALGGGLAALGVGVTQHFLSATAVFGVVALVASRWLLPAGADAQGSGPSFALPDRALLALGAVAFCALVSEGAMADWSAIYLQDVIGSGPGLAAAGFAAFSLAMAVGRLTGDRFIELLGASNMLRLGGALAASGLTVVLLVGSTVPALFGFVGIGLGLATLFPITLSAAARAPGMSAGAGIAAMSSTGYFGFLIGPPTIGFVAELLGLRGALVLIVAAGVIIFLLAGNAARTGKKT